MTWPWHRFDLPPEPDLEHARATLGDVLARRPITHMLAAWAARERAANHLATDIAAALGAHRDR